MGVPPLPSLPLLAYELVWRWTPKDMSHLWNLKSPADAPLTVELGPGLKKEFADLLKAHLDEGKNERGGTLVVKNNTLQLVNKGSSKAGDHFYPNLNVGDGSKVVGAFHTHRDTNQGDVDVATNPEGLIATSFGGADIAFAIDNKLDINVLYTGGAKDFVLVRTAATPSSVDHDALKQEFNRKLTEMEWGRNRRTAEQATQALVKQYAKQYGFALYEGKNGSFQRVEPPP